MSVLRLPVKREYFEKIKNGSKNWEYRLYNDYWKKRIEGKDFNSVEITLGYPKADDSKRRISRKWRGFEIFTIAHKEFGKDPVKVFAVRVNPF